MGLGSAANRYFQLEYIAVPKLGFDLGFDNFGWRFKLGVQYFKSGYDQKNASTLVEDNMGNYVQKLATYKLRFDYAGLSFVSGYAFNVHKRLNIVPALQLMLSTTVSSSTSSEYEGKEIRNNDLGKNYRNFAIWCGARVGIEYLVAKKLSVVLEPQYNVAVNSFDKYDSGISSANSRFYDATLCIGLNYWIKHEAKKKYPKWEDEH